MADFVLSHPVEYRPYLIVSKKVSDVLLANYRSLNEYVAGGKTDLRDRHDAVSPLPFGLVERIVGDAD